ncbi:MAG: hypothetical protein ACMG55_19525 [Microcoleus sp.]
MPKTTIFPDVVGEQDEIAPYVSCHAAPSSILQLAIEIDPIDIDHISCGTGPPSLFKTGNSCDV